MRAAAPTFVRIPSVPGAAAPCVVDGMTRARVAAGVPADFHECAIAGIASHRRSK